MSSRNLMTACLNSRIRDILNDDQKKKLDQLEQEPHPELHGNLHGETQPPPQPPTLKSALCVFRG